MPDFQELKNRLANRDRGQEAEPVQPAAPAVQPQAPAAPATPPPAAPAAPATPDPQVQQLQDELAAKNAEFERLQREAAERDAELQAVLAASQEKAKLPSDKELEEMSSVEAAKAVGAAMTAQMDQKLAKLAADLHRDVVAPTVKTVGEVALTQKRETAQRAYPDVDMNKYRKAFDEQAKRYPDMSATQVLKSVADPRDLSPASPSPTTPTNAPQPAGAHIEGGVAAHASPSQPQPTGKEPQVIDHLEESVKRRQAGDHYGADQARREGVKKRLRDQGKLAPQR